MKSFFTDKKKEPTEAGLKAALGKSYEFWKELALFTNKSNPSSIAGWHFSGEKYGWSFRISDANRVLVYLLPRKKFFKVALVFGQKGVTEIQNSTISDSIKNELLAAKAYAEGRGIRIDVRNESLISDLKKMISIKINN